MGRPQDRAPRSILDRVNIEVGKESLERTRSIAGRQSEAAVQLQDHTTYFRESVGGLQESADGRNSAMMSSAQNRMKTQSPEAAETAVRMAEGNC